MDTSPIWGIISFIISFSLVTISIYLQRRYKERENEKRRIYTKKEKELINSYYEEISSSLKDENNKKYLINFLFNKSLSDIKSGTKSGIEAEATKNFNELKKRIGKIEERFPEESSLEKLASVNDAILGTKVEELTESIKKIESNLLTKWDVVKILFTIIGAFSAIMAVIAIILKYLV